MLKQQPETGNLIARARVREEGVAMERTGGGGIAMGSVIVHSYAITKGRSVRARGNEPSACVECMQAAPMGMWNENGIARARAMAEVGMYARATEMDGAVRGSAGAVVDVEGEETMNTGTAMMGHILSFPNSHLQ